MDRFRPMPDYLPRRHRPLSPEISLKTALAVAVALALTYAGADLRWGRCGRDR